MINFVELTIQGQGKVMFNKAQITCVQESTNTDYTVVVTSDCTGDAQFYVIEESYAEVKAALVKEQS